ncbi:MAG: hypothetical protein WD491_03465 [Balneolales bacterium]
MTALLSSIIVEAVSKDCYGKASTLAGSALVHSEGITREAWTPHGAFLELLIQPEQL